MWTVPDFPKPPSRGFRENVDNPTPAFWGALRVTHIKKPLQTGQEGVQERFQAPSGGEVAGRVFQAS